MVCGRDPNRRAFLRRLGTVAAGSVAVGGVATAKGGDAERERPGDPGRNRGFPPAGITSWGDSVPVGEGEISTFVSVTPSGVPKCVGVHFSAGALSNLPYAEELMKGGGIKVHGLWMQPFPPLGLPDDAPEPMNYVGLGWNPQGHTPIGVYDRPHFDIHFYFNDPETIGSIGPGTIENLPTEVTPEGYELIEGGTVVPKMGAHLAPEDAPEFDGAEWLDTLIWGAADVDADDAYELNFIEPMITVDYLENHLDGVRKDPIAQPEVYPQEGHYPTTYTIRALGDGGYAVVLEDFEVA